VQSAVPLHNVALKEIAYYLIILKNVHEFSTEILLKLYLKYSVDKTLMESILSIHRSCAEAFIQDKIEEMFSKSRSLQTILYKKSKETTLDVVINLSLKYLDKADLLKMLILSKTIHKRVMMGVFEEVLARPGLHIDHRVQIYKLIVPPRFLVNALTPTADCVLSEDNTDIIRLDLHRTCKDDKQLYQAIELVLYNFVKDHQLTTGYFQGLNFVAHYICVLAKDPKWTLSLMNYVAEYIYSVDYPSYRRTISTSRSTGEVRA